MYHAHAIYGNLQSNLKESCAKKKEANDDLVILDWLLLLGRLCVQTMDSSIVHITVLVREMGTTSVDQRSRAAS